MDQLPWVSPEKLKETLHGLADERAERIMRSMNDARAGHLIDDTEEPVRVAGLEFVRAAFEAAPRGVCSELPLQHSNESGAEAPSEPPEAALQQKVDAAEASFSPSGDDRDRSGDQAVGEETPGEQGTTVASRPDGQRTGQAAASLVARPADRQPGAGR